MSNYNPTSNIQQQAAWPPQDATIVCYNVSKAFGQLVAVSNLSVAFRPGVTGLLGPNGAGKSTLIRLICGLAQPNIGQVWVAGGNPRESSSVRSRVGVVPQQDGVFERATARQVVELSAALNKVPNIKQAAENALAAVELDPNIKRPVGAFSKGMRQRVKIAQALVYDPPVIILDEPLNGLDPKQRKHMIELFAQLGEQGRTVVVSSHVLEEVERFGSHIVVLSKGRLAAEGDYKDIRSKMDSQPRRIRISCENAPKVAGALIGTETVQSCGLTGPDQIEVTSTDLQKFRHNIASICKTENSMLTEITPLDDDLESVFKYLVDGV